MPEKLENMMKAMLPKELLLETAASESQALSDGNVTNGTPEQLLEELPMVDGLDWQYAWMHLPDLELLQYTVKEFYDQLDTSADHLQQAYAQLSEPGRLDAYRIQVHAMKSLAATVGIMPLSGVAKILEYAAKSARIDIIMSVTPPFLEEWRSYQEKLKGVFGIGTEAKEKVEDYSMILALVEMVRISMQEMDIDQADKLVGQLRAYEYPEDMNQNMQKLAEAVTNLDVEEACRLADLLIGQMEEKNQ